MSPRDTPSQRGMIAGAVATAVALSLGEFVTALSAAGPGLLGAMGDGFIDLWGAALKDLAVALFGTNHRIALVAGMVMVGMGAGALLGHASHRDRAARALLPAGFGLAALGGLWVYALHPLGDLVLGVAAVAVAFGGGIITWRWLDPASTGADPDEPGTTGANSPGPAVTMPGTGRADRRRFLQTAGGLAAGAGAVAVTGVSLREFSGARGTSLRNFALPVPRRRTPIPTGSSLALDGLEPYITPTEDFFRIDTALRIPRVNPNTWRLRITGLVERPQEFDLAEILAMDAVEAPITLACVSNEVGGDLVGTALWQGVPLADLLARAGVLPSATQVIGESVDGFTAGFPVAMAEAERGALLAYAMNGEPLPSRHGFPVRLVVPGLYGYVSATKWLREIRLTTWEAEDGYWIPRGWSRNGPIKIASRIDRPRARDPHAAGPVTLAGVALAPMSGVAAVEVQVDDGPWHRARLATTAGPQTWVQWQWEWQATPGTHEVRVRAISVAGEVQTGEQRSPAPDGATGWHSRRYVITG